MRFVCWLWRGAGFWKQTAKYDAGHVVALDRMLRRHGGHQLTCVHDGTFDLPPWIDALRMPPTVAALPDYLPKLWAWSAEFHSIIGERFASIDLDVVLLGDVAPVLEGAPFRIWDEARLEPFNTSLFALDPGFGDEVWRWLTPGKIAEARAVARYWTGDQSWVAHVLHGRPGVSTFGTRDGVHRYRGHLHAKAPPAGTLAMFMCGPMCPRSVGATSEWVRESWR